ncbi:MAG TPA: isoprenyl transferase [Anaerolineales bacterium]|nr:isoprenyl transferase [Anaerolineae bacterium]HIQ00620.1 isoprenyl transferase [Anaerolineales bacterium]
MSPESKTEKKTYPPLERVPAHVGIIMDGNGRWAQARGLPRLAGHRAGTDNLRRVLRATAEFGVHVLTIYAFSTENWGRPEDEVHGLMELMERMIDRELPKLHEEGVQIRHIGRLERVPDRLKEKIRHALELTKDNQRLILNVAFNYGGRSEIVDAVRRIIQDGVAAEAVDEALIARYLYTAGLPDPDLIVRTSGELRVSNFLIWQGAYAEYYVTPTYWPDFDKDELYKALVAFNQRERRFGLLPG